MIFIRKKNDLKAIHLTALFAVLLFLGVSNLSAQFPGAGGHVKVDLISEVPSIQPGGKFWVAIRQKMDNEWHTYWRNPGDSGLPTYIEWTLPEGFSASETYWPVPEKIDTPPLVTYGYHNEVYLLSEIEAPEDLKPGQDIILAAYVEWLECKEACLPGRADVQLSLPVTKDGPEPDYSWIKKFADVRSNLPLSDSDWRFEAGKSNGKFIIKAESPDWFKGSLNDLEFYPYHGSVINYGSAQKLSKSGKVYLLEITPSADSETMADTLEGILVTNDGWRGPGSEKAIQVTLLVQDEISVSSAAVGSELSSIWLAILFSFIGGMILNLMPCVLPVLSIKIMGFVQQANDKNSKPWLHGLVFTSGVLVSFWILAGALLILQAGGEQLGWGFQLQSPVFLILLSFFIYLFGLSMFGVFEIGTSLTSIGGRAQSHGGWTGSFISGVTATIVATPCTAPFMGSALGFALSQPAWVAMTIFTFLGLGMAFPYVLLSSIPKLLRFVPKPGRWMESMKEFMGFLLMATVVWLLWVLSIQAGAMMVIIILGSLLFLGIAGWIYGRWGNLAMPRRIRVIATSVALILMIGSVVLAMDSLDKYSVTPSAGAATVNGEGIVWQTFSPDLLTQLQAEGNPVFLDFTAAWCLSCQVNEQVAFSSDEVQNKFAELGVVPLKADWTARDETITKALAQFGRNSVPLYVLYPGGENNDPVILPEIITPGIVLDALQKVTN